jgi:hypothetical protein
MLIQSFIQQPEQESIKDFIYGITKDYELAVGENGFFWKLSKFDYLIPELVCIRNKCIDLIGKCKQEPLYQDFLVKLSPNGYIKEHTDPSPDGYKQIRANILIQSAEKGGELIHDSKKIEWQESDLYLLDPSKTHSVTKTSGGKDFLLVSYGFLIKL